jgi:hypothetical protein
MRLGVLGLVLLAALTGCSRGTPADMRLAHEPAVLDQVRIEAGGRLAPGEDIDETSMLFFGNLVCRELEAGRITDRGAVEWVTTAYPDTPDAVDAATVATILCPDWYR